MVPYLTINITTVVLALILFGFVTNSFMGKTRTKFSHYLFIAIVFFYLFFIMSFRGDFTSDYRNYVNLFRYFSSFSFEELINGGFHQELGYVLLNWLLGLVTDNAIYIVLVSSFLILYAHFNQFKKHSVAIWLSILLFINIGGYYDSFNITRQLMASSIVFLGSRFLYERSFLKYILVILLGASFHRTALVMIPFYFILNMRINRKRALLLLMVGGLSSSWVGYAINFIQRFFYSIYTTQSYGMTGLKFTNVVVPLAIVTYVLFHSSKLDNTRNIENTWFNCALFYTFFSFLGLSVQLIQRLSYFFLPYVLLLIPLTISRLKSQELKAIYVMAIVGMLILYNYVTLSGTGYDPYYFIWNHN